MKCNYPYNPFERYADDIIVHCFSETQAKRIKMLIEERLSQWKLELHPEKTRIVYCRDEMHRGSYPNESVVFLGYSFSPRKAQSRSGQHFVSFSPAVSSQAAKKMHREMRSWRASTCTVTRALRTCHVLVMPSVEAGSITMGSTTNPRFRTGGDG